MKIPLRFGETIAVLGLVLAALGFWESHVDRVTREKHDAQAEQTAAARTAVETALILRGEGGGARLRLIPVRADQAVQSQTFYFPTVVRGAPVQTTGEGAIEADWFAGGLKKALHGADDRAGGGRLPLGVSTVYVEDGEMRTDNAVYEVGFSLRRRLLQPAEVRLLGLSLRRRGVTGPLQAAVDAAWVPPAAAKPPPPKDSKDPATIG